MKKNKHYLLVTLLLILFQQNNAYTQTDKAGVSYKNQISTNLLLPLFSSFDLNYERTIANKWAIGLAGAIYGDRANELSTDYSTGYYLYDTNYEIMPFVRFYFQGAQNKSHYIETFGSLSGVEESGRTIRYVNDQGYGIYDRGSKNYTVGGLGMGYGYRFLLLDKKLVLEAQMGMRTNFNVDFLFLNTAFIRTGIKVGYRF